LPVVANDGNGGAAQPDGDVEAIEDDTKEAEKATNCGVAGRLNAGAALVGFRGSGGRDGVRNVPDAELPTDCEAVEQFDNAK
jgi:hypothetical protein